MTARVEVLTRAGCHLCEEALAVVREVCGDGEFLETDIDSDPALRALWSDDVPVVRVDGRTVAKLWVSADQLRAALTAH